MKYSKKHKVRHGEWINKRAGWLAYIYQQRNRCIVTLQEIMEESNKQSKA